MNKFVEEITEYLLKDSFFQDFKLRKRDSSLIHKTDFGNKRIELQTWHKSNQSNIDVIILPIYSARFDVLHKWFEKFSFKSLKDQRDNYTVAFQGSMLGEKDEYKFKNKNNIQQHSEFEAFKNDIIKNSSLVFKKLNSLNDYYQIVVKPVITKEKPAPDVGADWIFEYLLCTRIIDINSYDQAKLVLLGRVEELHNRSNSEPNIEQYYDKLDEILLYMENEVSNEI